MNAGLVDLIATIRGIVRGQLTVYPVISDTRSISSCLFLSVFYNSIFPFSSRCQDQTHVRFTTRSAIRKLQLRRMQTIVRRPYATRFNVRLNVKVKLSLNHGIIVDSDSTLERYELFTTFSFPPLFP